MDHKERFAALAVDPDAEMKRLENEVRGKPDDAKLRTYLFQLLALRGDWERALAQLQVAAQLSPAAIPMAQTYREAIRCEAYRAEVFAGRRQPSILGTPPEWTGPLLEALQLTAQGKHAQAEAMRALAFDAAPETAGTIGETRFAWIADADPRIGPMCEAIVDGKYVWVPFVHLAGIEVEAPEDLRDLVWAVARLRLSNGGNTVALIPARYPGTEASDDAALRLSRKTVWRELSPDTFVGLGQRMWATDAGEHALLDARSIRLDEAGGA